MFSNLDMFVVEFALKYYLLYKQMNQKKDLFKQKGTKIPRNNEIDSATYKANVVI
jgi:hypothetical protein